MLMSCRKGEFRDRHSPTQREGLVIVKVAITSYKKRTCSVHTLTLGSLCHNCDTKATVVRTGLCSLGE